MIGVEVRASRDLQIVARRLKEAGDRGLKAEARKGLRAAAKPVVNAAKEAARTELPHRGGLNEWVADSLYGVRTLLGPNPRVRIVGQKKGHDLADVDKGRIRHPVFGHRDRWVVQSITPHVLTDAMAREAPEAREALLHVLESWVRRLT